MKEYRIGEFADIQLKALPTTIIGFLILWIVLGSIAYWLLGFAPMVAVLGGLLAAVLHFLSELVHHLGHALAAHRTGYPMSGIRAVLCSLWRPLSTPRMNLNFPEKSTSAAHSADRPEVLPFL